MSSSLCSVHSFVCSFARQLRRNKLGRLLKLLVPSAAAAAAAEMGRRTRASARLGGSSRQPSTQVAAARFVSSQQSVSQSVSRLAEPSRNGRPAERAASRLAAALLAAAAPRQNTQALRIDKRTVYRPILPFKHTSKWPQRRLSSLESFLRPFAATKSGFSFSRSHSPASSSAAKFAREAEEEEVEKKKELALPASVIN